jgi:hypothetical protein
VSRFDVLHPRTRLRRYRRRRVPFSCFALPNSFWVVLRALSPFLLLSTLVLIFGDTVGAETRFHVLRSGLILDGIKGVRSLFHVLRSQTRFGRY